MVFGDMGNRNSPDVRVRMVCAARGASVRLLLAGDGVGRAVLRRKPVFFAWWNCASLPYGENPSFLHGGAGDYRQLRDWRYAGARLAAVMGAQSLLMDCFVEARQDLAILRGTSFSVFILLVAPQFKPVYPAFAVDSCVLALSCWPRSLHAGFSLWLPLSGGSSVLRSCGTRSRAT